MKTPVLGSKKGPQINSLFNRKHPGTTDLRRRPTSKGPNVLPKVWINVAATKLGKSC